MKHRWQLFSNSYWALLSQFVRVGSLAVITIALSRHLGPQKFGSLAIGLAFVRVFAVIATFGLDRIIVRRFINQTELMQTMVREIFWLKAGIALLSYMAMLVFVFTFERGDTLLFGICTLAGGGLLFQAFDIYDYAFQAQNRFSLTFLGRGVPILFSTGLKAIAIFFNAPLLAFAALETIEAAIIGSALLVIYRQTHAPMKSLDFTGAFKCWRLVAEGLPLLLGALAVMIYMRSDVVLLGKIVGYQDAGIYAAATQVSEACALLPLALMPALFPILVRWRHLGLEFYRRQFERLFFIAIFGGLAFSVALTFGAPALINILFGAEYSPAANVLIVHGWGIIFVFLGITQSGYEVTENLTWFSTCKTLFGATLNILLNLVLIPRYGAVGSAIATLIAVIFSSVLLNAVHPRTRCILRMQLAAVLVWPVLRGLVRDSHSSDHRTWQTA